MRLPWKDILIFLAQGVIYVIWFTLGEFYGMQRVEARYKDIGCYLKDGIVTIHDNRTEDLMVGGIVVERALDSHEGDGK